MLCLHPERMTQRARRPGCHRQKDVQEAGSGIITKRCKASHDCKDEISMSSILTNNGAMVALQTLKSINSDLATTQGEISTGKSVSSAKDNAAVWAIAKTMEADVKGFAGITDSLALGQSTVSVARSAAETVTELLTDIKGKIVSAQEENVDRGKIQTDIDALRDQIGAVVGAAQFNGLNLLSNTDTTAGSGSINVLASLDRSSSGVAASDISVGKQDLGTSASSIDVAAAGYTAAGSDAMSGAANTGAIALASNATPVTTLAIVGQTAGTGTTSGCRRHRFHRHDHGRFRHLRNRHEHDHNRRQSGDRLRCT